jgi:hypothetical protein
MTKDYTLSRLVETADIVGTVVGKTTTLAGETVAGETGETNK